MTAAANAPRHGYCSKRLAAVSEFRSHGPLIGRQLPCCRAASASTLIRSRYGNDAFAAAGVAGLKHRDRYAIVETFVADVAATAAARAPLISEARSRLPSRFRGKEQALADVGLDGVMLGHYESRGANGESAGGVWRTATMHCALGERFRPASALRATNADSVLVARRQMPRRTASNAKRYSFSSVGARWKTSGLTGVVSQ